MIIHDDLVANQFLQEFYARYQQADGNIAPLDQFTCHGNERFSDVVNDRNITYIAVRSIIE